MLYLLFSLVASRCISLQQSKECPELSQYAIQATVEFNSVETFDSYLAKIAFEDPSSVENFKELMQCPRFEGQSRFMDSTLCAFMVTASYEQCKAEMPTNPPPLNLCTSVCEESRNSLRTALANTTMCNPQPTPEGAENRRLLFTAGTTTRNLNDFCTSVAANPASRSETCFKGLKKELDLCGFHKREFAVEFCEANKSAECCRALEGGEGGEAGEGGKSERGEKKHHGPEGASMTVTIVAAVLVVGVAGVAYFVVGYLQKQNHHEHKKPAYLEQKHKSFGFLNTEPTQAKSSTFANVRESIRRASRMLAIPDLALTKDAQPDMEQGLDISQKVPSGTKLKCEEPYDPQMDDEMVCNVGDVIQVLEDYDDGWAMGDNLTTLEKGAFPKTICSIMNSTAEFRHSTIRPRSEFSLHPRS
jgi:hypothetical protein